MAGAASSDPSNSAWDPCVLGMKKHKLLREDVLPAMASNRKVQRLLNEFMDLLSEYEITETNPEHKNQAPSAVSLPETTDHHEMISTLPPTTDQVNSASLATDQMEITPAETNQMTSTKPVMDQAESIPLATDQMDIAPQPTIDQGQSNPPVTDQMYLDPPVTDQSNLAQPAKETGS